MRREVILIEAYIIPEKEMIVRKKEKNGLPLYTLQISGGEEKPCYNTEYERWKMHALHQKQKTAVSIQRSIRERRKKERIW